MIDMLMNIRNIIGFTLKITRNSQKIKSLRVRMLELFDLISLVLSN